MDGVAFPKFVSQKLNNAQALFQQHRDPITKVAIEAILALGVALCAVKYAHLIVAFFTKHAFIAAVCTHPLFIGGLIGVGSALYFKKVWDGQKQSVHLKDLEKKSSQLDRVFPIVTKDDRYAIPEDILLKKGSVKSIFVGTALSGEPIVSTHLLFTTEGKKKFALPDLIKDLWNSCVSDMGGGIGKILWSFSDNYAIQQLILPYYNGPNLWEWLKGADLSDELTGENYAQFGADILNGYDHLHKKGLVHGDPKAENIQLNLDEDRWKVYIIDTDLTHLQKTDPSDVALKKLEESPDYQKKKMTLGNMGSWAPELFITENLSKIDRMKAEVWGVGIILVQLYIVQPTLVKNFFKIIEECNQNKLNQDDTKKKVLKKLGDEPVKTFVDWLGWNKVRMKPGYEWIQPVLEKMLDPDPETRCTMKEARDLYFEALNEPIEDED